MFLKLKETHKELKMVIVGITSMIPSEIVRRCAQIGYEGVAITDHADFSNIPLILRSLEKLKDVRDDYEIPLLIGVEITHVPP